MRTSAKLIGNLVHRVTVRLPYKSGRKLEIVEQDPIVKQTVAAIIELSKFKLAIVANTLGYVLESVSKTHQIFEQNVPVDVMQSKLFVLRLLSACMQHHWQHCRDQAKESNEPLQLPALDEALVSFILTLMSRYITQYHLIEETNSDLPANAIIYDSDSGYTYEQIKLSLLTDIYKTASKVIYYVSASNWPSCYAKIKNAVMSLDSVNGPSDDIPPEIRMLECSCLTRNKLYTIFSELTPYYLHMRPQGKMLFSKMMRKAIWKWIEANPMEFVELYNSTERLLPGSEVLFDMCSSAADNSKKKAVIWPLQTILLVLSPDLLTQAFLDNPSTLNRRSNFLGQLRKSLQTARTVDIAAVCYVDICKAATVVPPDTESVLRLIAADVQVELKQKVWDFTKTPSSESALAMLGYTIDQQALTTDFVFYRLRLHTQETLEDLLPPCIDEKIPILFKLAFVKACLAIVQDENPLPWNPPIAYHSLSVLLRKLFLQTIQIDMNKSTKTYSTHSSRVELLHDMLRLFKMDTLLCLLGDEDRAEQNSALMVGLATLFQHPTQTIRLAAGELLIKIHQPDHIAQWGPQSTIMYNFWQISSQAVFVLARQMLEHKSNEENIKALLGLLHKLLKTRNAFLKANKSIVTEGATIKERMQASVALEIALLVLLCSTNKDICDDTSRCLGTLCQEARIVDLDEGIELNHITIACNAKVYEQLCCDDSRYIGRKAQQKRIRKYLRMLPHHTPGNMAAWEESLKRWKQLTQWLIRAAEDDEKREERSVEWQNYTGFLAALGGCCLAQDFEFDGKFASDRRISMPVDAAAMADTFIGDMIELLVSENVYMRGGAKDALGNDLAPALYVLLFRHLETFMSKCFDNNGDAIRSPHNKLFVEQSVLVLRLILDRLVDPGDCLLSIDFSTLMNQFADYLNGLPNTYVTLRVKVQMCFLVEAVMQKKEHIVIRDEIRLRNKLLEICVEWTSDFAMKKRPVEPGQQTERLSKDLDQACLKAIVSLLQQLPLQPSEAVRPADITQIKAKLFLRYFNHFRKLLDRYKQTEKEMNGLQVTNRLNRDTKMLSQMEGYQDWVQMKELTILALSHLLNANVDAGLKYSLAMGYDDDQETRTAFIQVLTNILNQGTEFETLAENVMTERYEKLIDMLVDADMEILMSLCEVCPSQDTSGVAEVLLVCFESRSKVMPLLKAIVEKEVSITGQEATLFRGTTMATRILSLYAKSACLDYVRITLQPAIEEINTFPDEDLSWELDPQKLNSSDALAKNKSNVIRATEILLKAICSSVSSAPRVFREELALIREGVSIRFPESKYISVGGFVFLRLFGPAILTPENAGFSKQALPRDSSVRKLLLQATRVMQNLANNVLFGAKETHMIALNDFLTSNIYRVTNFLRTISTLSTEDTQDVVGTLRMDQTGYVRLHKYLSDNLERMSRDLTGRKLKGTGETQSLLGLKKTLDRLSTLLAQLGRPSDLPQSELSYIRSHAITNGNQYYSEFMRRNAHRDLSAISTLNMFYLGGNSKGGRPVFYMICRSINGEELDCELLVYYMLRVMEPHFSKPFELLFDTSEFCASRALSLHWITQFFQLVFSELNDYLVSLHIYNPNSSFQRYVRKLPRTIINKLVKRTHFSTNLSELIEHISSSEIRLPKETIDLEKENSVTIQPVTRITNIRSSIPVTVKIGPEHLQIITVKRQEILYNLNSVLRDVYPISDLEDITAVPSSKPEMGGELMIKYDGGKSTMVLSSTKRDSIVAYLLQSKQRHETSKPSVMIERAIRPNDVPGRLLNMAFLNIGSENPHLRLVAYNLLYSLSMVFRFDVGNQLLNAKDLCIPSNSSDFIVSMSESLAKSEVHLTLEFLNEALIGFSKSNETMRQLCLDYMVPWLCNLAVFARFSSDDQKKSTTKTKDIIKLLIELTVKRNELYKHLQEKVWKTLAEVDDIINLVLDCFVQHSIDHGVGSTQSEIIADTLVTMSCIAVRGKVISRIRRVIESTSIQPCRHLIEHASWNEISILLRYILMLSFNNTGPVMPYLPEVFHIVSVLVSTGPTFVRSSVHELVVNTIHTLYTMGIPLSDDNAKKLHFVLNDVCDSKNRVSFGLTKHHANAFTITKETTSDFVETINLSSLQNIIRLLLDALNYGAPTTDIANMWRARWMGLVTSTAFYFNPAIQPRSFVTLGCLAQEEVDDDLIYQILVALKGALAIFNETDSSLIVSIMMCLSNIIENLPDDSRYLLHLFWLAIALVQIGHPDTFQAAVEFLQSVLRALDSRKFFVKYSIEQVLLHARIELGAISVELDEAAGVNFNEYFSFSVAVILLRGLKSADTKDMVNQCLTAFLEIDCKRTEEHGVIESRTLGYLAGLLPFATKDDTLRELLRLAGINDADLEEIDFGSSHAGLFKILEIPDDNTALLLVSLLVTLLHASENESEKLFLYSLLADAAVSVPVVFSLVYESLLPKMNQMVVNSQNQAALEAVKNILVTACSEPAFNQQNASKVTQRSRLDDLHFPSLGDPTFGAVKANVTNNAKLASRLLEIITDTQ